MEPDPHSIAAWLARLAADRLIVQSPRLVIEVERLLQDLERREVRDPIEMGHSLASLLAKDEKRWRQIFEHFREHVRIPLPQPDEGTPGKSDAISELDPVRPPSVLLSPAVRPRNPWPPWVQAIKRQISGKTWVLTISTVVLISIVIVPIVVERLGPDSTPAAWVRRMPHETKPITRTTSKQWSIVPVKAPIQDIVEKSTKTNEQRTIEPGPTWLWYALALVSGFLGAIAMRWRYVHLDYEDDVKRAQQISEIERTRLLGETGTLGIPYHVERVPPMAVQAIDDVATVLGRITRHEEGFELDVLKTIDRTIEAGGRVLPVHKRGRRKEAILVFVDIEDGDHPYRDAVEWLLDRWKRQGVSFVRYDYCERPLPILRDMERRSVTLDVLARRTEGAPLMVFSRMTLPQDYQGKLGWLQQLDAWPNRVWIDMDPRRFAERSRDGRRTAERVAVRLPRYPCTPKGLLAGATALATGEDKTRGLDEGALRSVAEPEIEEALRLWAAAACCVPDPTWAHLDSVRRALPEIRNKLPDPRYVQRLIDWVHANGYGEGRIGHGTNLRFQRTARIELIAWLRSWDKAKFSATHIEARVETRARRLLMSQLKAADVKNDAFEKLKRDMKMRVHEAILAPSKAQELLAEFAGCAVEAELRALLDEEMELQHRGAVASGQKGWSGGTLDTVAAWAQAKGVRVVDLAHIWPRKPEQFLLAFSVASLLTLFSLIFTLRYPTSKTAELHITPAIYKVVEEKPQAAGSPFFDPFLTFEIGIPSGEFVMGSPATEKDRNPDEVLHVVKVEAFELSATEVTQGLWFDVMATKPFDCVFGCGDDLPAQNVTWSEAVHFMNRLTTRDNDNIGVDGPKRTHCYDESNWAWDRSCTGYRLPTEAEWEYAARAGTTTAYSFGDEPQKLCAYGNGNALGCDDRFANLASVQSYQANPWNLSDMHGNVSEWVWDSYGPYPNKGEIIYTEAQLDKAKVIRGGSFSVTAPQLRSANRLGVAATTKSPSIGFRWARAVLPAAPLR